MLRLLAVIFLGVSACSFFTPVNLQTKRSTDLESRGIKRIAVVLPSGRVPEQASSATYASTPPEKGPSEEELSELLGRFVYSAMASMPNWQIVSEREVKEVAQSIPPSADMARLRKIGEMVYADALMALPGEDRKRVGRQESGVRGLCSRSHRCSPRRRYLVCPF